MKKELRILRLVPYFENGFKSVEDGGDGLPKSRIIFPTRLEQIDYQGRSHDDLEQMNLIVTPSVQPLAPRGNTGDRNLGQGNNGAESWVTA